MECGPAEQVFAAPLHPYTRALLSAVPVPDPAAKRQKQVLHGDPPSPHTPPSGCRFHTRCPMAEPLCAGSQPEPRLIGDGEVRCHFPETPS
ncbi:MAG: hypothetical protein Tsb0019_05680 [Roseibium sp.]